MRIIKWEAPMRAQRPSDYRFGHVPYKELPALLASWHAFGKELLEVSGTAHVIYAIKHYSKKGTLIKVEFLLLPVNDDEYNKFCWDRPGAVVNSVSKRVNK